MIGCVGAAFLDALAPADREAFLKLGTRRRYGRGDIIVHEERFAVAGAEGEVEVAVTQDELAAWVGASREAVTRAFHVLRTLGCVETHRGRVTILDGAALRRRAL